MFSLSIEDLLDYELFNCKLKSFGITVTDFYSHWKEWYDKNYNYFLPYFKAKEIINAVQHNKEIEIIETKIWDQAVVYYFIWLEFGVEVPHNDYANFFNNTKQIIKLVNESRN